MPPTPLEWQVHTSCSYHQTRVRSNPSPQRHLCVQVNKVPPKLLFPPLSLQHGFAHLSLM